MLEQKITFDKFIRWTIIVVAILAAIYIIDYLSAVLLPFFVAWGLAYLIFPIVKFVQYKMRVKIRALSIIIAFMFVISVLGGVLWFIIPPMLSQFHQLGEVLNQWIHTTTHTNDLTAAISAWLKEHQREIETYLHSTDFSEALKSTMPKVFQLLGKTASVIFSIVASLITLLYMFFILLDYEYLTQNWVKIFPKKNRPFWRELMADAERELNNYIRGQGTVSLIMAIMFFIGFTIIGFPMAIGLAILIGLMNMVPYLHGFALIPAAFLSMLKATETGESFWAIFGMVVLVFCVVQVISDSIVVPKVLGKAMRLNPAILLLSLSVWGALLGFIGLIIALPLTTLCIAYWQRYVTKEHENEEEIKEEKENHDFSPINLRVSN